MKISARNQLSGTVTNVTDGAVNGTVKVAVGGGITLTASITEEAIKELALARGDSVPVLIKASDVLIAK